MRTTRLIGVALAATLLSASTCGGDEEGAGGGGGTASTGGGGGDGGSSLEPICTPGGTRWAPGTPAFVENGGARGLTGVMGVRLSAVDVDGDGWTDLIARRGPDRVDDFWEGDACCATATCADGVICPVRSTWYMRNRGDGTFEDVTLASGIVQNRVETDPTLGRPGSVFAFGDLDNDGDLDAYVGKKGDLDPPSAETSELLINQGDGTFLLGPEDSPLRVPFSDAPSGAAFVDVDLNGALDLWITQNTDNSQPQQDHLYLGDATGLFGDFTGVVGMITEPWSSIDDLNAGRAHSNGWSALACDLNGDGLPELLASSYGRSPNHLWQAQGSPGQVTYVGRGIESGYAFDERVDWSDNESARCWCQLHPTDEDCAGVPAPTLIPCNDDSDAFRWNHATDREPFRLGGNSGATMCGDVDNDGDMDLLTTEIVHWDVGSTSDPSELLLNTGEAEVRFERPGNEVTGLTREHSIVAWNDGDITGAIFDFDNDAWPDVYIGSTDYPEAKGLLFHQTAPASFVPVPFLEGIDHNRSHGIAVADFDRDGDLDVVVGHSRARCTMSNDCYPTPQVRFFENTLAQGGNWVQLHLVGGPGTNAAAIGARVVVAGEDGTVQTQEVGGGHGHWGAQHDLTLHFGLGAACRAEVTVRWPNAELTTQTVELVSGYRYELVQGQEPQPAL